MSTLDISLGALPNPALEAMARSALEAECARRGVRPSFDGTDSAGPHLVLGAAGASISDVIRHPERVLDALLGRFEPATAVTTASVAPKTVVAVTACPTGIAHTFLAADALKKAASELGYVLRVETRGSVGPQDVLTEAEIAAADGVIVAADVGVETARFAGKPLLRTGTKDALRNAERLLAEAVDAPVEAAAESTKPAQSERTGPYKHLMTGVSHMLPLVVAGGLLVALAFTFGGIDVAADGSGLGAALKLIGGEGALALMIPILSGYIAFSIADRPGLTPGLVGGVLAGTTGAGFLGGILAGFGAGYLARGLDRNLPLPKSLEGLKPVLVLPLLTTLVVGLAMVFVVGPPCAWVMEGLGAFLLDLRGQGAFLLGAVLAAMMAVDMGGPVNKAAYAFAIGLIPAGVYGPMAAVMVGGMVPPLGLAVAAMLFPGRFTPTEREAAKPAVVLGLSFITEGAIPFAAADPLRVIPCLVAGSALAGALSLSLGTTLLVPHGGVFVLLIPHALEPLLPFVLALASGTALTVLSLRLSKRPLAA